PGWVAGVGDHRLLGRRCHHAASPAESRRRIVARSRGPVGGHGGTMTLTAPTRRGLTADTARALLAAHGPNTVSGPRWLRLTARVLLQLPDPLIVVLLVAALLTIATGDYPDAVIIAVVVVVNTTVGVVQEVRADRAIAALSAMTAPEARVRRDGAVTVVAAADVVPGDVVLLGEGDITP